MSNDHVHQTEPNIEFRKWSSFMCTFPRPIRRFSVISNCSIQLFFLRIESWVWVSYVELNCIFVISALFRFISYRGERVSCMTHFCVFISKFLKNRNNKKYFSFDFYTFLPHQLTPVTGRQSGRAATIPCLTQKYFDFTSLNIWRVQEYKRQRLIV